MALKAARYDTGVIGRALGINFCDLGSVAHTAYIRIDRRKFVQCASLLLLKFLRFYFRLS